MSIYDQDCEEGCRLLKVERDKLEAIKTLFLPLPEWVEWEEAPMRIELSKMLKLKKILGAEG